ncbi:MAG: T9SS type A sorting domain-containing protein [Chitinophagales bacterium]|nr:T9SS type A sorting domain-containing protein [Chitinophagales bacterium]
MRQILHVPILYSIVSNFEKQTQGVLLNQIDITNAMPVGRIISNAGNEPQSSDVKVIPNPIERNMLRIISGYDKTDFEIIDIQGRLMNRASFIGHEHIMDVGHMPQGSYFLRYQDEQGRIQQVHFIKL